ncbi:phosphohydrolase [Sporanaerobium hydrogeniformans]|uniref:Phosphohydrolase n=1 Tax=Sporanaerobium hydrogeniformans TaxID=3072179 RepID=A0AC61DAZ1_9FIRM|nr:diguanylate cyclase [Sporanaerobium hydrogeniformans]PHV70218.1 phosphohydrolase [Sporanaerobium hydrogeniformans]
MDRIFLFPYSSSSKSRIHFFVLLSIYLFLSYAYKYVDDIFYVTILYQFQNLSAIIIAFQCTPIGFLFIALLILLEIIHSLGIYFIIGDSHLLISLSSRLITLIACFLISSSQAKQLYYKMQQEKLIYTDDFTGLYNHRFFLKELSIQVENCLEKHSHLGLILLDIDNLKLVNDNFGQDAGDSVISSTAKLLQGIITSPLTLYRYQSDEFAVIVPFNRSNQLEDIAQHLKKQLDTLKNDFIHAPLASYITFSLGYSSLPSLAKDSHSLIKQAEAALYHSKNAGKDAIHIYEDILKNFNQDVTTENKHLISIFKALLASISMKDQYTLGHCERVASYAAKLASHMQLDSEQINAIHYAGLLHDIGKIEIPSIILNKTAPLSEDEYALIKKHPIYSSNILEPLLGMDESIDYVRHHHEHFDGSGYPDGLSGTSISLGARILAVVDSFDAMISERPYSKGMSIEEALLELKRCAYLQFDPFVVEHFITLMTE